MQGNTQGIAVGDRVTFRAQANSARFVVEAIIEPKDQDGFVAAYLRQEVARGLPPHSWAILDDLAPFRKT